MTGPSTGGVVLPSTVREDDPVVTADPIAVDPIAVEAIAVNAGDAATPSAGAGRS